MSTHRHTPNVDTPTGQKAKQRTFPMHKKKKPRWKKGPSTSQSAYKTRAKKKIFFFGEALSQSLPLCTPKVPRSNNVKKIAVNKKKGGVNYAKKHESTVS